MRLPEFVTRWLPGRSDIVPACVPATAQEDHFVLEDIARNLCGIYAQFVAEGRPRPELARVITGLAGVVTAQSCTSALAWEQDDPDTDSLWSQSDTDALSGLLLLDVARCVEGGRVYGITEPRIGELDDVRPELFAVAAAYTTGASIGQRLYELGYAVSDRTGSAAGEALMPLARAHGFECGAGCGEEDVVAS